MTWDSDVLTDLQRTLVEPMNGGLSWASGLWTVQEVIDYTNHRQQRFLKHTGVVQGLADLFTVPNQPEHPLPADVIEIRRVVWHSPTDTFTPLPRGDFWEADHGLHGWPQTTVAIPSLYLVPEAPDLHLVIVPPSFDAGRLEVVYVARGEVLSNAGAILYAVPDECIPAIKYGILADMLSKTGRAQDVARALYCEQRFQLGVDIARLLLQGWAA